MFQNIPTAQKIQCFGPNQEYKVFLDKSFGQGEYGIVFDCNRISQQGNNFKSTINLCAKFTQVSNNNQQKDKQREEQILKIVQSTQNNDNLIKIYHVQFLEQQQKLLVIMEKTQLNLKSLIDQQKKFTQFEIIDFMNQFVTGYFPLYQNNIILRNLKPENILLQKNFKGYLYKISDFGLGKIYKQNDFKFTKTGTSYYSAPEMSNIYKDSQLDLYLAQMSKKKCIIDMFSLGIIIYQLIYGVLPFQQNIESMKQFYLTIKIQPFRSPRHQSYNEEIFKIIDALLIYNPQSRLNFEQFYQRIKQQSPQPIQSFIPDEYFQEVKQYLRRMLIMGQQFINQQAIPFIENILNQQQWNQDCEWIISYFNYQQQNNHIYKDDDLSFFVSLKCLKNKQTFKDRNNRNLMLQFLQF